MYSTFSKSPGLEPHHQMQFSDIPMSLIGLGSYLYADVQLVYFPATESRVKWNRKKPDINSKSTMKSINELYVKLVNFL